MKRKSFPIRARHGERGAVATIIAVLMAGGVVMGMLALTVDVGSIWYERRQIQNGADAAALALAQDCAAKKVECSSDAQPALQTLAGRNAADERTDVTQICGEGDGTDLLEGCPASATGYGDLPECLPLPDTYGNPYVEARTATRTGADQTILPKYFSQLLVGGSSEVTVNACARAAWGPVGSTRLTMPLVIGLCNWEAATADGTDFAPSPPYSAAPKTGASVPSELWSYITPIFGHVVGRETDVIHTKFGCWPDLSAPPSGSYTPGGFGWVETCGSLGADAPPECEDADPCTAVFGSTGTAGADPGASLPMECRGELENYVGTEVDIPVITAVAGSGGTAVYTIEGIASYYLAGYSEMPSGDPKTYNGYKDNVPAYKESTCFPYHSSCVWGWFTAPLRPVGTLAPGGGTPRGPVTVGMAG